MIGPIFHHIRSLGLSCMMPRGDAWKRRFNGSAKEAHVFC